MTSLLTFRGKSDRVDWWAITLISGIVAQLALIFAMASRYDESGANWFIFTTLLLVAGLAIWSAIAVTVRRFREYGDSPWMTLLLLVPYIGAVVVLIICGFLASPSIRKTKVSVKLISSNPMKPNKMPNSRDSFLSGR